MSGVIRGYTLIHVLWLPRTNSLCHTVTMANTQTRRQVVVVILDPCEVTNNPDDMAHMVNDVVLCHTDVDANRYIDHIQAIYGMGRWRFLIQTATRAEELLDE